MKKILFLCTGNTCRSPMAEGIFKSLTTDFEVSSCGLSAFSGDMVAENAVLALRKLNIDISSHRARVFSPYLIDDETLFVCMSKSHKSALLSFGIAEKSITVLDVADPYGCDLETYISCAAEIFQKLIDLLFKLSGTVIRDFTPGDEKKIAEIEKECFSLPWSETAILDSYNNNVKFFVAEKMSEIVGYCGLQLTEDIGFVTNIAVLPKFRHQGIGRALTKELLNFLYETNLSSVSLEVRVSNKNAISIYEKLGFKKIGVRKNFYSNPKEDAFIYTYEKDSKNENFKY